ncbi:TPA: DUF4116 domain-containing protein [Clostridioides difficile]|uniref:DUF4116 domain-containing protein n=1 Tax=Clostridioides difficile TaxID=1496 RepID=UPI00016C5FBF|nr:DUF4116 domain-containing protein [Clostridioides difficile]EGT3944791.1 DUF4116 domain-containing protein [Clostridioides difficile]MBG0197908.1 DUF4116 domain-containing protein [Clostridioides difficile]MCA0574433.1 DUF4116 domain-containing protein [Clostridioides difficile]PBG23747.1 hypothetical protein BGU81_18685 [Clostridioides difficile]SJT15422.1 Uncharacterised protein [Clostridioides difficile]
MDNSKEEAVKQNGLALEFVKEQTEEICLIAVRQNGLALEFVKEQTQEVFAELAKQIEIELCIKNILKYNNLA